MRYNVLNGISKFILILIIILFQTSALTIGGMMAKALLTGIGASTSGVDAEGADTKDNSETEEPRNVAVPTPSGVSEEKKPQAGNITIELETVIKDNTVEIYKVVKKDEIMLDSETAGRIQIPEQALTGTGPK